MRAIGRKDRNTQHSPNPFQLYEHWREGFKMLRLIQDAENELRGKSDGDECLSPGLIADFMREGPKHPCFWKRFYQPFENIHITLYLLKFLCNCFNTKAARRTEVMTLFDRQLGGTGKTLINTLATLFGGPRSKSQPGYVPTLQVAVLQQKTQVSEAPSESMCNLELARLAIVDDFHNAQGRPLVRQTVRQVSGAAPITSGRKRQSDHTFISRAQIVLINNDLVVHDGPLEEPDERRHTGIEYLLKFTDENVRNSRALRSNERPKDSNIKFRAHLFIPEIACWVLGYHHIVQAAEDSEVTLPRPLTAAAFREPYFGGTLGIDDLAKKFIAERLMPNPHGQVPPSRDAIQSEFHAYGASVGLSFKKTEGGRALEGHNLNARDVRPSNKCVRAYVAMKDGKQQHIWAFKPAGGSVVDQLQPHRL